MTALGDCTLYLLKKSEAKMIGLTDNYNYKYSFKMYICLWFDEISRPIILPIKKGKWSRKTLIIIFISQTFQVTQKK